MARGMGYIKRGPRLKHSYVAANGKSSNQRRKYKNKKKTRIGEYKIKEKKKNGKHRNLSRRWGREERIEGIDEAVVWEREDER